MVLVSETVIPILTQDADGNDNSLFSSSQDDCLTTCLISGRLDKDVKRLVEQNVTTTLILFASMADRHARREASSYRF